MRVFVLLFVTSLFLSGCGLFPSPKSWEYVSFYPSGFPRVLHGTQNSKAYLDSTFTRVELYENGQVKNWSNFMKGELDGTVLGFYELGGQLGACYNYELGKLNGAYVEYYPSGLVKSEYSYFKGQAQLGKTYFENGQLIGELEFEFGRLISGVYYYSNGNLRSKGSFRYSRKIGTWYSYDSLGVLIDSTDFGDPVGDRIRKAQQESEQR
ncbi:toxin-antitoxin system YwqK family antitoxin [Roseivirga pacifica]|uniref:toxin-antitoxin system YwqK family antitoxin n=1 Tax=Roseivirga pacifica TaxID=1267423 RepID=UPI00227D219C|nr:hypothetical protein [Roseivirga pacifica]